MCPLRIITELCPIAVYILEECKEFANNEIEQLCYILMNNDLRPEVGKGGKEHPPQILTTEP